MKLVVTNLAAVLVWSLATASSNAGSSLHERAKPKEPVFLPCKESTCAKDQECFAPNPKGAFAKYKLEPAICMALEPKVTIKCKSDEVCLFSKKAYACRDQRCYKPVPMQKMDEKCDFSRVCNAGLACYKSKCKTERGGSCTKASECPGVPCSDGKCQKAGFNGKCTASADCDDHLYCETKSKTCKHELGKGQACQEDNACGSYLGKYTQKCYKGACQLFAFETACKTEGLDCVGYLICEQGMCQYRLQEGDSCEYSSQCEFGLCEQGVCYTAKGLHKCINDGDCGPNQVCNKFGKCCGRSDMNCRDNSV